MTPRLTVIVATYNMGREAPRTLHTLSAEYQTDLTPEDFEVRVVDNGSSEPLDEAMVAAVGPNFSYRFHKTESVSPVAALNEELATVTTEFTAMLIDGARMVTPGALKALLDAALIADEPLAYLPSLHLGPQLQNDSMESGYDQDAEDELLASIDWQASGYDLFSISNVAGMTRRLLTQVGESNCYLTRTGLLRSIGGYDERFQSSGGGFANYDIFKRLLAIDGIEPVAVLGEASFHQFHGGASTNHERVGHPSREFRQEYFDLKGTWYEPPRYHPTLVGRLDHGLEEVVFGSNLPAQVALVRQLNNSGRHEVALGALDHLTEQYPHDPDLLALRARTLRGADRIDDALAAAIEARDRQPNNAGLHVLVAQCQAAAGNDDEAEENFNSALELNPRAMEAFLGLSRLQSAVGNDRAALETLRQGRSVAADHPAELPGFVANRRRLLERLAAELHGLDLSDEAESVRAEAAEL